MKKTKTSLMPLGKYMGREDRREFERLLRDKTVTYDNCQIFANNAITHRQITEGTWSINQSDDMEYKDYIDQLNEEEQVFIRKFYNEMYANRIYVPEDYRLLQTEEMIKESNRINNMRNRDLFEVKKKRGQLDSLEDKPKYDMQQITDEDVDWHQILDMFGYESAVNFIIDQCIDEFQHDALDKRLILVRYYVKMNKLKREMGNKQFFNELQRVKDEQE